MLEVIVGSLSDAVEAERGGADRLEVIRDFERGGMTPTLDLVKSIRATVSLPLRVMLRENDGYTVQGEAEIEKLCATALQLQELRVDGIVLGFLRDGEIDFAVLERILSVTPEVKLTFHHAIEETKNPLKAIRQLKRFSQVDHLLASGGAGDLKQRIGQLRSYLREAGKDLTVLAGGGLDAQAIKALIETTDICEFHVGRASRVPAQTNGVVKAERVRELVRLINGNLR